MRDAVSKAVAAALQNYHSHLAQETEPDDADGAAASRTRCLVCERTGCCRSPSAAMLPYKPPPPENTSTVSPQQAAAEPASLSSPRTSPAAATLTTTPPADAPAPGSRLGGTAGSSLTGRLGPMGPGINAARHRNAAALHKTAGRPSTASAAPPPTSCSSSAGPAGPAGGAAGGLMVADLVSSNLRVRPALGVSGCTSSSSMQQQDVQAPASTVAARSDPGTQPRGTAGGRRRPTAAVSIAGAES